MVCRSNPASSVVIALARDGTWLDDAQVQSVFHRLRHDPVGDGTAMTRPGRQLVVLNVFARARDQIEHNPALRPQRRQGLRERLERSRSQTDQLGEDTLSAMLRLQSGVHVAQQATEHRLYELAGRLGMSAREVQAEFVRLRAQAPSGRQSRATAQELAELGNIPADPATRHALQELGARAPLRPPVRLVQRWVRVRDTPTGPGHEQAATGSGEGEDPVTEVGTSDLSNRVELRHRSGRLQARSIPVLFRPDFTASHVTDRPTPGRVQHITLLTDPLDRAEQSAYAVRCDDCGRFTGDRTHECPIADATRMTLPTTGNPTGSPAGSDSLLRAPAAAEINAALEANRAEPVAVEVSYDLPHGAGDVTGSVTVRPGRQIITDPQRRGHQSVDIDDAAPSELWCSGCADRSCAHITQTRQALRRHLSGIGALDPAQERQRLETAVLGLRVTGRPAGPDQVPVGPGPAVVSFLQQPEAFRDIVGAASADQQVPFRTGDVLHGHAAGRRFGIELEYNADRWSDSQRIAEALAEADITDSPTRHGYHHTQQHGDYNDSHWTLESDCTVPAGGELVTSICTDDAASWTRLRQACQIIRDHGGTTHGAGSHTNISADGFSPEQAWRLIRMCRMFEDDIQRMGRTPGSRRDRMWAGPLPDPGPRWRRFEQPGWLRSERYHMVNFCNAFGGSPRLEFRFPDASHDPGVIQAQVNLAAALTGYVRDHDIPDGPGDRPTGTAHREGWADRLASSTGPEWEHRTRPVRTLIDQLFDRAEDRQQVALLWARGHYLSR